MPEFLGDTEHFIPQKIQKIKSKKPSGDRSKSMESPGDRLLPKNSKERARKVSKTEDDIEETTFIWNSWRYVAARSQTHMQNCIACFSRDVPLDCTRKFYAAACLCFCRPISEHWQVVPPVTQEARVTSHPQGIFGTFFMKGLRDNSQRGSMAGRK